MKVGRGKHAPDGLDRLLLDARQHPLEDLIPRRRGPDAVLGLNVRRPPIVVQVVVPRADPHVRPGGGLKVEGAEPAGGLAAANVPTEEPLVEEPDPVDWAALRVPLVLDYVVAEVDFGMDDRLELLGLGPGGDLVVELLDQVLLARRGQEGVQQAAVGREPADDSFRGAADRGRVPRPAGSDVADLEVFEQLRPAVARREKDLDCDRVGFEAADAVVELRPGGHD